MRLQSPSRGHERRGGAAIVEFAIVAPVFFMLVLGFIEIGRAIMVTYLLTNGARVGCRTGVIQGKSSANITTSVNSFLSSVGINTDTVNVQVNDGAADASTAVQGDEITVNVAVTVDSVTWLPGGGFLSGSSLTGQFTLRRE